MINEVFNGIQGEGKTQGQYRTFIRFNKCNLKCSFCDSSHTWGKGDEHHNIEEYKFSNAIVLTGGEPCLQRNWDYINEKILYNPRLAFINWIEIETNGTNLPHCLDNKIDLWNISPKQSIYMIKTDINCEPILLSFANLLNDYIVKFVIKDFKDLDFVQHIQNKYNIPNEKIWLMPYTDKEGNQNTEQVYDYAVGYGVNFSSRLHVLIKGNKRKI